MNTSFILSAFLLFLGLSLSAQEPTTINFTTEDGLLSNEVYSLMEDKDGFIWIGTDKGASRFDSYQMLNITTSDGLADSDVLSIHQDSKENIWFLSYNGKLSYWNKGKIYNSRSDKRLEEIRSQSYFTSFLEDKEGSLWFGTHHHGAYRMDTSGKVSFIKSPENIIHALFRDEDSSLCTARYFFESIDNGTIYYTSNGSVYEFNGEQFGVSFKHKERHSLGRFYYSKQNDFLFTASENNISAISIHLKKILWSQSISSANRINKVATLSDQLLYVATDNGLYSFDQEGNPKKNFLLGKGVTDMLIDREGNLWISTLTKGMFIIRNREIVNYTTASKYVILPIKDTILFGGTAYDIHFVTNHQIHSIPITYYMDKFISKQDRILSLAIDANHQIWLGTQKGFYYLKDNTAYLNYLSKTDDILPYNNSLFLASYIATLNLDSVAMLNNFNLLPEPSIHDLYLSSRSITKKYTIQYGQSLCFSNIIAGKFFMGTKEGVFHYSNSSKTFHQTLPIKNVIAIRQASNQDLWLLKRDSGLYFFQAQLKKLSKINIPHEPKGIFYTSLDIDENGNPWVSSNKGAFHFEKTTSDYNISCFNQQGGLGTDEINDLKVIGGDIWLATANGISHLPKQSLTDSIPPLLFIDSISIGGISTTVYDSISLLDDNNFLSIYYTGISYKDLGELTFEYHLEGKTSWNATTTDRMLLLTDLTPSKYTLSISAIDAQGNQSEIQKIHFKVTIPWWKNWINWIIILFLILIMTALTFRIAFKKSFSEMYELLSGKIPFLEKQKFITVKSATTGGLEKVLLRRLYYIEAAGDYMEFYLKDKKVLVRTTLKALTEELVEEPEFMRVHKSYIVNLKRVDAFRIDCLEIMGKEIPIARDKRTLVKEYTASL